MGQTDIAWTDKTWNPVTGCTKISPGCKHCYAESMTRRFWRQWGCEAPPNHFKVKLHKDRLQAPLHWKKPCRIFVPSMSDLFHERVPFKFVTEVFATMYAANWHTYQILTKRMGRAIQWQTGWFRNQTRPLPQWIQFLGSASTQAKVEEVVPLLMQIPAAVRGLSLEPLLGPIDLELDYGPTIDYTGEREPKPLHWIPVGCESGSKKRPCELEWIEDIVRQCKEAQVACFVKQIPRDGKVFRLTQDNKRQWPKWAVQEYPRQ